MMCKTEDRASNRSRPQLRCMKTSKDGEVKPSSMELKEPGAVVCLLLCIMVGKLLWRSVSLTGKVNK